uniref:BHLH domain-containing protein n=1 Tax=Oryza rufipogon TaxID=4529 RepID=A0A0E0PCH7_ORYRU
MASAPPVQEEALQPGTNHFRSRLAAAVRSISWSYTIFWSTSTSLPGVLTWNDGFYNGEVKTRKISNLEDLTADQLVLRRSEQLRELYYSLLSGECDHRARKPVAALSPEDIADTEWYYVVCMTYAFRPGQGLPGRSYASNRSVWLCNAQSADSKTFLRALLAKTIVCIPFMSGVLELGTTDPVSEDPNLVNRIVAYLKELQFPICLEGEDELGDVVVAECETNGANPETITMETDEFYSLCEELDLDLGSYQLVPTSARETVAAAAAAANDVDGVAYSHASCFVSWKRANPAEKVVAVPMTAGIESQKLLKKAVGGGTAWMSNIDDRGSVAITTTPGSNIKSHVMSERRRREKLNEMFLILKSLLPSVRKVDKASILAETITYLKVEKSERAGVQQQGAIALAPNRNWTGEGAVRSPGRRSMRSVSVVVPRRYLVNTVRI